MIREKIAQAFTILQEKNVDLWLIFGRESHTIHEPCADLVVGPAYTWQSAFLLSREGRSIAIVGNLDEAEFRKRGDYDTVIAYKGGIREDLRRVLNELDPQQIAINYSLDDPTADGLTHGLYLLLLQLLEDTPYAGRLIPAEPVIAALRGRKSAEELRRIRHAIRETETLYAAVDDYLRPGLTEREVHQWLLDRVREKGYETAWAVEHCPAVFTGVPEAGEAHTGPTDKKIERGHVLNMDFGLKISDYCSDLQRTWYVLREGETAAPPEVEKGFRTVVDTIAKAAEFVRPGVEGWKVDDVARQHIVAAGFDEYPHGLGHQVGRSAHDGAGLFCPRWERYGNLPYLPVEEGQVYTIEPRVRIPGYGVATVEEIIVVTRDGGQFLSSFQRDLWLVH